MDPTFRAVSYLRFLSRSVSRYKIHSPFIYGFVEKVLKGKGPEGRIEEIINLKHALRRNSTPFTKKDLGAGMERGHTYRTTVADVARRSVNTNNQLRILYRLANYLEPALTIELGSALGISSAALASGYCKGSVITIEGSRELVELAQESHRVLNIGNVNVVEGNFDDELRNTLISSDGADLVFIDGNHRFEPTLRYFETCLEHSKKDMTIVVDDIHWSKEMQAAWQEIVKHPEAKVTLTTYTKGYVFYGRGLSSQHFVVRY